MPKVILTFAPTITVEPEVLSSIGAAVKPLVADAVSTVEAQLGPNDVDWLPSQAPQGSSVANAGIELVTIGYPARKRKLTDEVITELKRAILAIPDFAIFGMDFQDPLIWVQYVDPAGQHI